MTSSCPSSPANWASPSPTTRTGRSMSTPGASRSFRATPPRRSRSPPPGRPIRWYGAMTSRLTSRAAAKLAGMLDVVNNYVPSYQQNLDQVAQSLMGSVNYLMSTGYDQAGNQGAPFFLGTGASDIEVNPALVANPADIGANASPLPAGSIRHERGRHRGRRGWRTAELSNGDDVGPRGRLGSGRARRRRGRARRRPPARRPTWPTTNW